MQQPWNVRPVSLKARDVQRIDDGRGLSITCLKGSIWITQDRDLRDIILGAGQSFVLDRNGLTVVFAFDDASILVSRPGQVFPASYADVASYRAA
jgi:hypothetical protein